MLLHLVAHLAGHHALGGLLWHCDLALMLERDGGSLDWDRVLADAGELGLRGAFSLVFDAVQALCGVAPPAEVRRSLPRHRPRLRIARRLLLPRACRLEATVHLEPVVPLLLVDRGRDCARALAAAVVPSPSWVQLRYERPWPWAYARHYGNALGILGRTLAGSR